MTITSIPNTLIIIKGKDTFTMRHDGYDWIVQVWDENGNLLPDMMISNCTARAAWYAFYHMARRRDWYAWYKILGR